MPYVFFNRRSIFVCVCTSEMKCFCLSVCAWDHTCFRWAHVHKVKFNFKKLYSFENVLFWPSCHLGDTLRCILSDQILFDCTSMQYSKYKYVWRLSVSAKQSLRILFDVVLSVISFDKHDSFWIPEMSSSHKLLTEAFACKSICVDFLLKCIWDVQELSYLMALTAPLLEHS